MTRLVVNGPRPPDGGIVGWCAVCVAVWKAALIKANGIGSPEALAAWAKEKLSGPDDAPPVVLAVPPHVRMPPLAEPVTRAPVQRMGGAIVDVCWTHADALDPPGGDGPSVRKPPGLIQGMS